MKIELPIIIMLMLFVGVDDNLPPDIEVVIRTNYHVSEGHQLISSPYINLLIFANFILPTRMISWQERWVW